MRLYASIFRTMSSSSSTLVQIASYNTNLQGDNGVPQDLVDWLNPTFQASLLISDAPANGRYVSSRLIYRRRLNSSDIIAVGFQELLPLYLGLSGLSNKVINNRNAHILEQIEAHSKERYALIAKVVNGGVALLVYARDAGIARTACDVQTSWTGSGPAYMGNKEDGPDALDSFVCAHLTAHAEKLSNRIADWNHIVGTLLFDGRSTLYETSHLFVLGDMNFRVVLPADHPLKGATSATLGQALSTHSVRENLKEFDQLLCERRKPGSRLFVGLRESEFWGFKCSYKYYIGGVDHYSEKRTPSWTDRILYTTYTDSPDVADGSTITNLLYTSIPGYTTSDHKPIVSLLLLPPTSTSHRDSAPLIRLPDSYLPMPDSAANRKRYTGRVIDRIVGRIWWLLTILGAGSAVVGIFNFIIGLGAWGWWRTLKTQTTDV
ncbi:unnamed protein product [Mycena citricolor]|uniref:Inositol polyphosphate-related phosphatase domain-containing protein n=1 Tax=Mycena citricolor TaxID=2018698 RepID=A0AAD2HM91_9AGAR|nr:unnamed protein product [Mycena citricolor]